MCRRCEYDERAVGQSTVGATERSTEPGMLDFVRAEEVAPIPLGRRAIRAEI